MATYSYKGYDFDVDHNPTEAEFSQMSQYVDTLPPKSVDTGPTEHSMFVDRQQQILPDLVKNLGGVLETGAGMLAGLPSQIAGGLAGAGDLMMGRGIDKAATTATDIQKDNFGFGAYEPFSEQGKNFTEGAGNALMKPIELAGDAGEYLGGNEGRFIGELLSGTAMAIGDPLAPLAGAAALGRAGRGGMKAFKKAIESTPKDVPSVNSAVAAIEKATKPVDGPLGQLDMFPESLADTTGHATPYDAGTNGVFEPTTPKRARAQQELPLRNDLPESINIDREGVSLRPEDIAPVEAAKNAEMARMDAESARALEQDRLTKNDDFLGAKQEEMWAKDHSGDLAPDGEMAPLVPEAPRVPTEQADLFPPQTNMHRDFTDLRMDDGRGGERPLTKTEFEQTVKNLMAEQGTRFPEADLKAAFEDYKNSVENPGLFETPARAEANRAALAAQERMGDAKGMGEVSLENIKKGKISNKGSVGRQRGALDLSDLRLGFGGLNKRLSKLTDILAQDMNWQTRMIQSLGGKEYLKNSDGTPRVLLHGTIQDIKGPLRGSEQGFHAGTAAEAHFFTNNGHSGTSKSYFRSDKTRTDAQIHPLVVKNGNYPRIESDAGNWSPQRIVDAQPQHPAYRVKADIERALADKGYSDTQIKALFNYVSHKKGTKAVNEAFSDVLKRADIDGFFYRNQAESPRTQKVTSMHNQDRLGDPAFAKRAKVIRESPDPYSFVTWNDRNFKSIFDLPPDRTQKPIGQRGFANKQTGAIQLPFGKKPAVDQLKKVAGIKENLKNFFPEEKPIPEVIKDHIVAGTKDVDQNWAQRSINHLTKGSLYQAIKTNNPVIKITGDVFRAAENRIKAQTGELVHDTLAPLARALSKKEKADVWAIQNIAEAKGFKLTPEFMQEHGFNQKQIDWVEAHGSVMKDMYTKMADTMKAAGLKPVSERVAYLASRARGDFRKLIYDGVNPDGKPKVVGILGDNTRMGLNKQVAQLKEKYPDYVIGEERYFGGRAKTGTSEGFSQMLEFLSENDPGLKTFVNRVNDMLTQDAYNYMNSKSHTMDKKRIFGMEGRKEFASAVENAKEGMAAQVRYAETMIKWSELSKAVEEVKPLLKKDNGLDMPIAKQWAQDYVHGAMGYSPGALGRALDDLLASAGKVTGVGTSMGSTVMSGTKQVINGLLLGFWNAGFIGMNLIQPFRTMPEMASFLRNKGVASGADWGLGRSIATMMTEISNKGKLSPLEKGALDYAEKNHVYSSNLFESGNTVNKDTGYYWNKGTQSLVAGVEQQTRKLTYLSYVHMLKESGISPEKGLFEAAQNLTDVHMNNYSQAEAPRIFQETGPIGRTSYNLMSFKHNELSRLAMLAREVPQGHRAPFAMALASQVAFAGIMGTIGFKEADAIYEKLSAMFGKPSSLTKDLIENPDISDYVKYGIGNAADADLTSRMGIQLSPGSIVDTIAPGASKLGNIAKAGATAITNPNEYNAKNFVREAVPNSIAGIVDRAWFSPTNSKGEELSMNRNKVQASAVRNDRDKLLKSLGLTGLNESKQKTLAYANQKIDMIYKDKRASIIDNAAKSLFTSGRLPESFGADYVKNQGDPNSLQREIETMAMEQQIPQAKLQLIKNAMSTSITSTHKAMRATGRE